MSDRGESSPVFLGSAVTDNLMEMIVRLAGELWVVRERLRVLEGSLVAKGAVSEEDLAAAIDRGSEQGAAHDVDRQGFVERIFSPVVERSG